MKNFQEKLDEYRRSIDRLDTILIYTLGERFKQTELIGRLKAEAKIQASDHERESAQIEKLRKLSADANLDAGFAEKILTLIISEVVRKHEEIRSNRY